MHRLPHRLSHRLPARLVRLASVFLLAFGMPAGASGEPPATRLVQFVLLEGSRQPVEESGPIPPNVGPVLEDVAQLLPFKGYRLLDVAVVRSDRVAQATMHGPAGARLVVRADFAPATTGEPSGEENRLQVRDFEVVRLVRSRGSQPDSPEGRETAPTYSERSEGLIETSFSAEVGQTVVVGTSRLNGGDRALIVLFTALE